MQAVAKSEADKHELQCQKQEAAEHRLRIASLEKENAQSASALAKANSERDHFEVENTTSAVPVAELKGEVHEAQARQQQPEGGHAKNRDNQQRNIQSQEAGSGRGECILTLHASFSFLSHPAYERVSPNLQHSFSSPWRIHGWRVRSLLTWHFCIGWVNFCLIFLSECLTCAQISSACVPQVSDWFDLCPSASCQHEKGGDTNKQILYHCLITVFLWVCMTCK